MKSLYKRSNNEIKQFYLFCLLTWICWIVLYVVILANSKVGNLHWLENLSNNLASLMLLYCFITLSRPAESNTSWHIKEWIPFVAIILALTLAELLLNFQGSIDRSALKFTFRMLSGILAGGITAQLVGRIDSKLINPPSWVLFCLYSYAAIQVTFAFFEIKAIANFTGPSKTVEELFSVLTAFMLCLALFFKGILSLLVLWAIRSRRLFYYFLGVRVIHEFTNSYWSDFYYNMSKDTTLATIDLTGKWSLVETYENGRT